MSVISADLSARIKVIVCDILELDESEVSETDSFIDDHGTDSMSAIEVLAALEREFDIVIDPEEIPRMLSLGGVQEVVFKALS